MQTISEHVFNPPPRSIHTISEKYSDHQREYCSFFFTLFSTMNHAKQLLLKEKIVSCPGKNCALVQQQFLSPNATNPRHMHGLKYIYIDYSLEVQMFRSLAFGTCYYRSKKTSFLWFFAHLFVTFRFARSYFRSKEQKTQVFFGSLLTCS